MPAVAQPSDQEKRIRHLEMEIAYLRDWLARLEDQANQAKQNQYLIRSPSG